MFKKYNISWETIEISINQNRINQNENPLKLQNKALRDTLKHVCVWFSEEMRREQKKLMKEMSSKNKTKTSEAEEEKESESGKLVLYFLDQIGWDTFVILLGGCSVCEIVIKSTWEQQHH